MCMDHYPAFFDNIWKSHSFEIPYKPQIQRWNKKKRCYFNRPSIISVIVFFIRFQLLKTCKRGLWKWLANTDLVSSDCELQIFRWFPAWTLLSFEGSGSKMCSSLALADLVWQGQARVLHRQLWQNFNFVLVFVIFKDLIFELSNSFFLKSLPKLETRRIMASFCRAANFSLRAILEKMSFLLGFKSLVFF